MAWPIALLFLCITATSAKSTFLEPTGDSHTAKDHLHVVLKSAISTASKNSTNGGGVVKQVLIADPTIHAQFQGLRVRNISAWNPLAISERSNDSAHRNITTHSWGTGVVHFLFLINDRLPHGDIWKQFLQDAPLGSFRALVHCKDLNGCIRNKVFSDNPGFIQVETTPTWYCHDLVTAMAKLLSAAVDLNAAVMGGREKFVFVSESTLPIKPFSFIHSELLVDDNSDFCLFPSSQWGSATIDGSFVKLVKHHQWVVLSRDHARFFVRSWIPVNAQSEWRVWLKSGTWQVQNRQVLPQSFYYPAGANTCTDEWAFMATIFGALEPMNGARYLPGYGGAHVDMDSDTAQGRCRTWSYWDNAWDPEAAALGTSIANDVYGSRISCYPKCHARPASLEKLSHSSLHALRKSNFLFARKFSDSLWMPHFYDVVLSK